MFNYDLTEFFKLSSVLNYNLSAASLNRHNVLTMITAGKPLAPDEKQDRARKLALMDALNYLFMAYQQKRRRLGPMAVLHPLRATILFARSTDHPDYLNLLTVLFHDILEDVHTADFSAAVWREMETGFDALFERLPPADEEELLQRMSALTRIDGQSYFQYIERLLVNAAVSPDLVLIKLADRLDNTLDMRVDIQDPMEGVDFFRNIFQILFVKNYAGYAPALSHPPVSSMNGARRLYQLFKNVVLLSMIRQHSTQEQDERLTTLFNAVADASLNEAQRTLLHIAGYHFRDVHAQRRLIFEAMQYCYSGKSSVATKPGSGQELDGLFADYFGALQSGVRNQRLDALYQNKPLMIQACVAFITVFLSFLNEPDFWVEGIGAAGVLPR